MIDWLSLGLTTQSELQRLYCGVRDEKMFIKEAVVACFSIYPEIYMKKLKKGTGNCNQKNEKLHERLELDTS
jgi:hypothetical protein